ncbi:MAG TPA: hypothetical protein VGF59_14930 [Bryobacteraceae bacterium]
MLAALNVWIAWRLFGIEYTPHFNSVEGFFIGLDRYLSRHWGDFSWFPLWHCGMPFSDTYVPLLHLVVAAIAAVGRVSAARAYHIATGAAYCLGPVTLYLMALRLGASRGAAFVGGLAYSLFSPSAVLIPEFAKDLGSPLFPRRLQVLLVYGEGAHVTAMTFLALAILALQHAVEQRTGRASALAAGAIALVFLTNVPGTMALALAIFCWLVVQPAGARKAAWRIAALAALFAYGIACFGVPPSSLATVFGNAGRMHSGFSASLKTAPYLLPLTLSAAAGLAWLMTRAGAPLFARFAALYGALTMFFVFTARHPDKFELLPQVGRLHLEMEMGISLLIGWIGWTAYTHTPRWMRPVLLVLCLAPLTIMVRHYRTRARFDLQPVDPATRSEYTSARWLDRNLPGQRVYVMGSTGFWLNAFGESPQVIGCCDQGQAMPVLASIPYLINAGTTPDQTALGISWLEALGASAIVVNGPESTDEYKDIQKPERFEGLLPLLVRARGDSIYSVPQAQGSLAHVLHAGEEAPADAASPAVVRYAAAIEDASRPRADFQWLNGHEARIRATLARGDAVSVQVAYFRGWKATANGAPQTVSPDGIGFILLRPECEGNCEIRLRWTGPWDWWLSLMLSLGSLAGAVLLLRRGSGYGSNSPARGISFL